MLVDQENRDPRRGLGHENFLTQLALDSTAERVIASQGLQPGSIPPAGQIVFLRETANLSTGGTAEDCTDEVHPENRFIAEQAAALIGLDVAGIDFLLPDAARLSAKPAGGLSKSTRRLVCGCTLLPRSEHRGMWARLL